MLDEALEWACRHVTSSTHWHDLHGPASAVVATLIRLGWSVEASVKWKTAAGATVDMSEVAPRDVEIIFGRDAELWAWRQSSPQHPLMQHLAGAPFLGPVLAILKGEVAGWTQSQSTALKAVLA